MDDCNTKAGSDKINITIGTTNSGDKIIMDSFELVIGGYILQHKEIYNYTRTLLIVYSLYQINFMREQKVQKQRPRAQLLKIEIGNNCSVENILGT